MWKHALLAGLSATLAWAGAPPKEAEPVRSGKTKYFRLAVGHPAPDFELKRLDGKGAVKLSGFKGKRPVVLIFGSYT